VDNEWRAAPTGPAVQSKACLPILVDGQPIGVLILRSPEPDFFDLEEVRLLRTLTGNLGFALELIHKQEQLNYLAYYDALTGLPNRTLFQDRLNQALGRARRGGGMAALIIFDVERFKAINDSLGQPAGDRLLQLIADRLRGAVGDTHHLARLAGNQFSVLLPTVVDEASVVRELGEQAGGMFEAPFDIQGNELRIAAKAGIAVFPGDGADADTLFRNAEAALKRAKASGDPYLFYAPQINALVAGRLDLENRLRKAVQLQQFVLHYQPKVDLLTRRFTGLEALIRWNDPDNGLVPPGHFIALLEETGLIQRVGKWAMEEAIRAYRGWSEKGLRPPRVAVNLSPVQLRQRGLVEDVRALAAGNGEACGLDLEITESLLMENVEQSTEMLRAIRDIGVRIGIDDFGTGYSSLSYIHKLPVDLLKIDRSFIAGMTDDAGKTGIVSTIISLAQSLRLKVVAEGVETEDQAQLLRLLRCDQIQGFLISRPIPEQEIESLLREQAASA
jgi:diguanylate cyclase (GGDEF)-like protein